MNRAVARKLLCILVCDMKNFVSMSPSFGRDLVR